MGDLKGPENQNAIMGYRLDVAEADIRDSKTIGNQKGVEILQTGGRTFQPQVLRVELAQND